MSQLAAPANNFEFLAPLVTDLAHFPDVSPDLAIAGDDGSLRQVAIGRGVDSVPGPVPGCGWKVTEKRTTRSRSPATPSTTCGGRASATSAARTPRSRSPPAPPSAQTRAARRSQQPLPPPRRRLRPRHHRRPRPGDDAVRRHRSRSASPSREDHCRDPRDPRPRERRAVAPAVPGARHRPRDRRDRGADHPHGVPDRQLPRLGHLGLVPGPPRRRGRDLLRAVGLPARAPPPAPGPPPGVPRPDLGPYARKRVLRIAPASLVTVVLALSLFPGNADEGTWRRISSLLLLDIYTRDQLPHGITHLWSLSVEVAFYVLLPLLMVLALGRGPTRCSAPRRMLAVLAAMVAVNVWWHLCGTSALDPHVPGATGAVAAGLPEPGSPSASGLALLHVRHQQGVSSGSSDRLVELGRMPGRVLDPRRRAGAGRLHPARRARAVRRGHAGRETLLKNLVYAARRRARRAERHVRRPAARLRPGHVAPGRRATSGTSRTASSACTCRCISLVLWSTDYRLFGGDGLQVWALTLAVEHRRRRGALPGRRAPGAAAGRALGASSSSQAQPARAERRQHDEQLRPGRAGRPSPPSRPTAGMRRRRTPPGAARRATTPPASGPCGAAPTRRRARRSDTATPTVPASTPIDQRTTAGSAGPGAGRRRVPDAGASRRRRRRRARGAAGSRGRPRHRAAPTGRRGRVRSDIDDASPGAPCAHPWRQPSKTTGRRRRRRRRPASRDSRSPGWPRPPSGDGLDAAQHGARAARPGRRPTAHRPRSAAEDQRCRGRRRRRPRRSTSLSPASQRHDVRSAQDRLGRGARPACPPGSPRRACGRRLRRVRTVGPVPHRVRTGSSGRSSGR